MIRGRVPRAPAWLVDTPLAHRGLHAASASDGPAENTLEAFAAARDAGYGVELDVRITRDGTPVIGHDDVLPDGRSIRGERAADLPLPTLAQALRVLGVAPVMVELKQEGLRAGALERASATVLDAHAGPTCVASFHPASVAWFRRHRPALPRVLTATHRPALPVPGLLQRRLSRLADAHRLGVVAVSYDVAGLPHESTLRWREAGGSVVTWTVCDAATLGTAETHADNIIFEGIRP